MTEVGQIDEDALIRVFTRDAPADPPEVIVPNGDDAAVYLPRAGLAQVVTVDGLVEGIHFDLSWSDPRDVGRKLMAVNLSDLAAMGAEPRYALLAVCLPAATSLAVVEAIADGLRSAAREHAVSLIGGNVSRIDGPIVLHATLIGEVERARVLRRGTAAPGDAIYVTGSLGDARLGLEVVRRDHPRSAAARAVVRRLVDPVPRVEVGRRLAMTGSVHSAADISDGLGRDLRRLLPGLGAEVDGPQVPISAVALEVARELGLDPLQAAVEGGEDYELLITAAPTAEAELTAAAAAEGVALRRIGVVRAGGEVLLLDGAGGRGPLATGFQHFSA